jgi:hypothetical protein
MLDQLRGRNLAHVGCTLGLTAGLLLGLLIALVIIQLVRTANTVGLATAAWLGVTVGLGVLGYFLGGVVSRRLWGNQQTDS